MITPPNFETVDLTCQKDLHEDVEIGIVKSPAGHNVLYINDCVNGITRVRICRFGKILIKDARTSEGIEIRL